MNAACAAMGGVILLLIVGAQVMDWRWLAALAAAGALAGFGIVRRHAPSRYAVAQLIDRNLGLHDSISTAYFYNRIDTARGTGEMRAAQLAEADQLAHNAEIERAVPFSTPRSVYVMALLGLIATGLLGLRYGITRSLDLHAPLAAMLLDTLRRDPQPQQDQRPDQKRYQELISRLGLTQEDNANGRKAGGSKESASVSEADQQNEQKNLEEKNRQQAGGSSEAENMRQNRDQAGAEGGQNSEQQGEKRAGAEQSAMNSPPQPQQAASAQQHESNSLMDKVRDAVSSLMSRFNSQPQQGEAQQMASNSQSRSEDGNQRSGESQQQRTGRDGQPSRNRDGNGAQGQKQQGNGSDAAQAGGSPAKGGEESADASKQPGSGAGSRDGNKEIREAEQLAAMGKISEIIGRRSQNLTGDATIEVASSGTQRLRTGYSQQNASHADSGGEILRDEIPLAYQRYVQKYFEQVRKEPAPATPVGK